MYKNNSNNKFVNNVDFKNVCDHLNDGIYVTDRNGITIYINDSYAKNLGVNKEEIIGKSIKDLEGKFYKGAVSLKVLEQKKRVDSIGTLVHNNLPVLVTGIPVFDDKGDIDMVVVSNRNMTELNEMRTRLETLRVSYEKNQENLTYLINQDVDQKQIIYTSSAMQSLLDTIKQVAKTDATVLITGETGTGKELIANEIFRESLRNKEPFIKINCTTIPPQLLESELFGYEPGSFTGALKKGKLGIFELANNGTLLLDEIGEIPLDMQAKLLRVLQEKEIRKIGAADPIPVDVRLIAATNRNLADEVKKGEFREDLYYRLNVVPLIIPPLRTRPEDIAPLANHFLGVYNKKYGKEVVPTHAFYSILASYPWPGNIRELENLIERMIVTSNGGFLNLNMLNVILNLSSEASSVQKIDQAGVSYAQALEIFERDLFISTLKNNKSLRKAASALGISPSTLSVKCKKYKVNPIEFIGKNLN